MAQALVILAEGFEEIEAVTIVDVLRRASINVTVAALASGPVHGAHHIAVVPDVVLQDLELAGYDAVVLPGGMPGAQNLREDPRVVALVRRFAEAGKLTAAICAGPTVLEAAGVLKQRRATSYPGHALPSAQYVEERVVEDGNIITSRGPATALEFAIALVARLTDADTAREQAKKLLM